MMTDVFIIISGAVLLSIAAAPYLAFRASRVSPVRALEGLQA